MSAGYVQAGTAHSLFFDKPVTQATVQDPQGKQREYPVTSNPWVFTDAQRVGVYIVRAGEAKHYLVVNLLDETESNINPANKVTVLHAWRSVRARRNTLGLSRRPMALLASGLCHGAAGRMVRLVPRFLILSASVIAH